VENIAKREKRLEERVGCWRRKRGDSILDSIREGLHKTEISEVDEPKEKGRKSTLLKPGGLGIERLRRSLCKGFDTVKQWVN